MLYPTGPARAGKTNGASCNECTCGECPPSKISRAITTRLMFGILQAMKDLQHEVKNLEPKAALNDLSVRCAYPYNWIPQDARDPRREVLIGVHNILLVVYAIMEQGSLPEISAIRDICQKESESLYHANEYFECGGSVSHILSELAAQVESDLECGSMNCDSEELEEELNQLRPCALDETVEHWRNALEI
ncbi:hypothetical protein H4R18_004413 [Coemansia javaensis]|uniref:Uncharacterized protein n=1 Tax=Coemansia javaensis TaxID=2761396 RepID=A0A9W8H4C5_9FUNG|nr:hypothetical protein H4R18_004413 [Coemansia javaensis]